MVQLEGFQVLRTKSKVCKLFKCFYGLCQASHAWNIKYNNFLCCYNLQPNFAYPRVYIDTIFTKLILATFVYDA